MRKVSDILFRTGAEETEVNGEERREQNVEQENTEWRSTFLQINPGTCVFVPMQFFRLHLSVCVCVAGHLKKKILNNLYFKNWNPENEKRPTSP